MSQHLTTQQEKLLNKIRVFQEEIATSEFHSVQCPALYSELQEVSVMLQRMECNIHDLLKTMPGERP